MLHDFRLIAWLHIRHARTKALRLIHAVGTDPTVDRGFMERAYQFYIAVVFLAFFVLAGAFFVDSTAEIFASGGAGFSTIALVSALTMPASVFALMAFSGLRTSPLKFSHPDIAFLAASPLGSRSLVATSALASMLVGGVGAAFAGYLLGVGLEAGLRAFASPAAVALASSLLVAAAIAGAWLVGIVRLVLAGRHRVQGVACGKNSRWGEWGIVVALGLAAVAVTCACAAFGLLAAPSLLENPDVLGLVCLGGCVLVALEVLALGFLAPHIDMTVAIEESALHADLQPFGPLSPLDSNTIGDYRRRRKVARRMPRFRLPRGNGAAALVSRATLSLVRQYDGLPNLFLLGAVVTPLGVCALFGAGGPLALMIWLALLVMIPQGPRELTRVFRDDVRIRLVRDQLPFRTLGLLAFDSLPAFILVCILSCAVVPFVLPGGASLVSALGLGILINAVVALSCGLDAVRLFPGGPRPWGEVGLIVLVAVASALSFQPSVELMLGAVAVVGVVIAAIVRGGVESA